MFVAVRTILATYPAAVRSRTSVKVYDALVLEVVFALALVADSFTVIDIALLVL